MVENNPLEQTQSELQEGMSLVKCRRCGCMRSALESLRTSLRSMGHEACVDLTQDVERWLGELEATRYSCLGCEHCYPAAAANALERAHPEAMLIEPCCAPEARQDAWPPLPGEYAVLCKDTTCPVAVSTLASVELAEELARLKPRGLAIVGKTETENIGIEKIIVNVLANPYIRFLVLVGQDPQGHHSGQTLLALGENGVDQAMRVVGSLGQRPVLRNVTSAQVEAFRQQVRMIDLLGCEDPVTIVMQIEELIQEHTADHAGVERQEAPPATMLMAVPVIQAQEPAKTELDKAGYFVIIPLPDKRGITVENYSYDNVLLRTIEGQSARALYATIIAHGWVTQLSHAAYLGKELARAELALKLGFKYVQEGA